jgi:anti-sigma regulatory factor (Ser/Thr protein kinase)
MRGDLADAGRARSFARSVLARRGIDDDVVNDVVLCVSEAVTNAIRHAEGVAALRLAVGRGTVRVEVADAVPGELAASDPGPDATSGRGLLIIQSIASRWGVRPDQQMKVVWFEVDLPSEAAS